MPTRGRGLIFTFHFRHIRRLIHAHSHHGEKLMGVDGVKQIVFVSRRCQIQFSRRGMS